MKFLSVVLTTISIIALLCVNCSFSTLEAKTVKTKNFSISQLDKSIDYAAVYIKTNLSKDGRFVYERDACSDIIYDGKRYNVLRHAGTLYAMSLYETYTNDEEMHAKRILASEYLLKNYVKKLSNGTYAVVSKKEEEKLPYNTAKLGGTGLALIGISDLYKEGKVSEEILTRLGEFIIYMQKKDGSFYSKYNYDSSQKDDEFISLYYPGEAALGLLYLNDVIPDKKWVNSAKKTLLFLADYHKNKGKNVAFDHWAMLATSKLIKTENNGLTSAEKDILLSFAHQMAEIALNGQITDNKNPYRGAREGNIRPCSIATYMEGEVAIFKIIDDDKLKTQLLRSIMLGVDFLASTQITTKGETFGGIPRSANYELDTAKNASVIRIDNVQHTISAWITYRMLFK